MKTAVLTQSLLRDECVKPRVGSLLRHVPADRHQAFEDQVEAIWSDLLARFRHPIEIRSSKTRHSVTVFQFARYVVSKTRGTVTIQEACIACNGRRSYRKAPYVFAVDLPLKPTLGLFEGLLSPWCLVIVDLAINDAHARELLAGLPRLLRKAALRTLHWKRLRHAIRDALALDGEILDLARRSRVNAHEREVTNRHYNQVATRLASFRQLRDDNPNLLWLYGLALAENVEINPRKRNVVSALRERILSQFTLPPAAWRRLANGRRRDFRLVIDWLGPDCQPNGRWLELREWLRLLVALERAHPVPLPVQRLFLHDAYRVAKDRRSVLFQGVSMPIQTVRCLIDEAERHLASGTLRVFTANDLPDVLSWLSETKTVLDERQQKAGWGHLLRKAQVWKLETALKQESVALRWDSLITRQRAGNFTIAPITDAWQLYREALGRRNCCAAYLADCLGGSVRLFSILNQADQQVGTVGLTRDGLRWKLLDVRGFANTPPDAALQELAEQLASRYSMRWIMLHPLLEQTYGVPVKVPSRRPDLSDERQAAKLPTADDSTGNLNTAADDEDDDPYVEEEEEDGDWEARICPFCANDSYDCEHLLAAVDYGNGGVFAGLMREEEIRFVDVLWSLMDRWAATGRQVTGLGSTMDEVLSYMIQRLKRGDPIEAIKAAVELDLSGFIYRQLDFLTGISISDWEFQGWAPGTSTSGRNYWARDPETSLGILMGRILIDTIEFGSINTDQ